MTTAVQHRRGTTAEHATFTGLEGEVTIDTTKDTAVIHDGVLAGGVPLARENLANVTPSGLAAITGASTASDDKFFIYDQSATTLKSITRAELNNAMEIDALANVTITGGTINGTTIGNTTAAAGTFTSITNTGGTANGVTYLNGSKVLTTGSALTWDAQKFEIVPTSDSFFTGGLRVSRYSGGNLQYGTITNNGNLVLTAVEAAVGTPAITFRTSTDGSTSTEQMRLTSTSLYTASGINVGIGTSSTSTRLSVDNTRSDTAGTGWFTYTNAAVTSGKRGMRVDTYNGYWFDYYNGSTWSAQMGLDSSGNLGLGVTPSAWSSASRPALQLPNGAALFSRSGSTFLGQNFFYNSSDTGTYIADGFATLYYQASGQHQWFNAPSGTAGNVAPLTQAMTLSAAGGLSVGTPTDAGAGNLLVNGLGTFTATTANGARALKLIGRPTTNDAQVGFFASDGTTSQGFFNNTPSKLSWYTPSGSEAFVFDSSGNLGLGVAPSAWGSGIKVLQFANDASLSTHTAGGNLFLNSNAYYNGTNWIYSNSNLASQYQQFIGKHIWYTAPSGTAGNAISFNQAMTLDASGRLLIGGTSTYDFNGQANLVVNGTAGLSTITIASPTSGHLVFADGTSGTALYAGNIAYNHASNTMTFGTDGAFGHVTIDAVGNLLVGTASAGGTGTYRGVTICGGLTGSLGASYDYVGALYKYDSVNENGLGFWNTRGGASPAGGAVLKFYVGTSFTTVGNISTSASSTSYNTSSDYRLKENVVGVTGASARVQQLNPVRFNFIADLNKTVDGFLAHEVQNVVPEAITGTKDEVETYTDDEGNEQTRPVYQGIDQSKLVPLLTAALQEALAKIESLEARLDAANI
jgi:hypothetical protein